MKRKSSQPDFLTALQTSRPSADAAFVQALKQKLLAEAEEILPEPRVSGLAFIFQSMKRYSLAYTGALVLVAFGTLMLLPKGLDPQEFLAKASEQYEVQSGIFHEERLSQRFENDIVVETALDEIWMDEQGNFLQTLRNPDTKETLKTILTTVDENGETISYADAADIEEMGGMDEWDQTFAGNKYYCAQMETTEDTIYKAYLKIAEEDPTVYSVDGESGPYPTESYEDVNPAHQLFNEDNSASTIKKLLETIANENSFKQSAYIEGSYFVFESGNQTRQVDGVRSYEQIIYTYFNLENYKLEKQKLTFVDEPHHYELVTYLQHEYLPAEQSAEIFKPSKYNLTLSGDITAGGPEYIEQSGCYYQGTKLTEEEQKNLLETLPPEAITQWNEIFKTVKEDSPSAFEDDTEESTQTTEEFNSTDTTLPEDVSFIRPTEGTITQGFHAGHPGYDIANRAQPDILAAASGTIEYASTGTWDGGYGDNIWINHGNGYKTHYAHLNSIYVKEGDTVTQGQAIGKMGNSGRVYGTTGILLHFELTYKDEKVSPSVMNVW